MPAQHDHPPVVRSPRLVGDHVSRFLGIDEADRRSGGPVLHERLEGAAVLLRYRHCRNRLLVQRSHERAGLVVVYDRADCARLEDLHDLRVKRFLTPLDERDPALEAIARNVLRQRPAHVYDLTGHYPCGGHPHRERPDIHRFRLIDRQEPSIRRDRPHLEGLNRRVVPLRGELVPQVLRCCHFLFRAARSRAEFVGQKRQLLHGDRAEPLNLRVTRYLLAFDCRNHRLCGGSGRGTRRHRCTGRLRRGRSRRIGCNNRLRIGTARDQNKRQQP